MFLFQNSEKQQKREYVRLGQIRIEIKSSKSQNTQAPINLLASLVQKFRRTVFKRKTLSQILKVRASKNRVKVASHFIKMYPNF